MNLKFKQLLSTITFGVIPFAIVMVITALVAPEYSFISSTNVLYTIMLTLLYWLLFAVIWSALTVLLVYIGTVLKKLISKDS